MRTQRLPPSALRAPSPASQGKGRAGSSREVQAAAELRIVELSVVPGEVAVDPGRRDARAECRAFEWGPAALREYRFTGYGLRRRRVDQGQVGPVPFADEAAFTDIEQLRRRMRAAFDDQFERQLAVEPAFERALQDELHERQAGWRLFVALALFLERVW